MVEAKDKKIVMLWRLSKNFIFIIIEALIALCYL